MTATHARKHASRIEHLLDPAAATPATRCGEDARHYARYSPADNRVDPVVRPLCEDCRRALYSAQILDGSRCYDCGEMFEQPEAARLAATDLDDWNELEPKHARCFQ